MAAGHGVQDAKVDEVDALQVETMLLGVPYTPPAAASCRICLDGACDEGDRLLAPCRCKGTMQYVHASCLDRWRTLSTRGRSATACDQCGAAYRFRRTWTMRLLTSRVLQLALGMALFLALAFVFGILADQLWYQYLPEHFEGTHPYQVQSAAYRPGAERVLQRLQAPKRAQGLPHDALRSEPFHTYRFGLTDEEAARRATIYSLGSHQPGLLTQLVQGMLQRLLERPRMRFSHHATSPWALRHLTGISYAQRHPAAPPPAPVVLRWPETLMWHLTLGLACWGVTSASSLLVSISLVGPLRVGAPFAMAQYSELATPGAEGVHAHVAWVSVHLSGVFLLGAVFWGIARNAYLLCNSVRICAQIVVAHMPTSILDYDTAQPAFVPPLMEEGEVDGRHALLLHAVAHGVLWTAEHAQGAARRMLPRHLWGAAGAGTRMG